MQIRKLTIEDAPAFREIRIEMCRDHPEAFSQTPEEVAELPDDKFIEWMSPGETFPEKFVIGWFEGERLVGTVGFRREDAKKEAHVAWIWTVYVRPEGRGKKIAKQLMEFVIDEAHKMDGLEMLTLTVAVTQTSARTLYTSLGFYTTGLNLHGYKLPDGRYIDLEEMILWLKK